MRSFYLYISSLFSCSGRCVSVPAISPWQEPAHSTASLLPAALERARLGSHASTQPGVRAANYCWGRAMATWECWVCSCCSCAFPMYQPSLYHPLPQVLLWRPWGTCGDPEGQKERARHSGTAGDCQGVLISPEVLNTGDNRGALASLGLQLYVFCLHSCCKPESAWASQKACAMPQNKLPRRE